MHIFKLTISHAAVLDVIESANWYNKRADGLGDRFKKVVEIQIDKLKNNALSFNVRYSNVRCMPINKFPFLVHYVVDEISQSVNVFAVIHTSRNPDIWNERNQKQ